MPSLDIVSRSHPNPALWYNDGLGDWVLAWKKPYSTVNGYYYKVSTAPNALPGPADGTLLRKATCVVKANQLAQGTNYFHLVSVDSAANFGKVKATASMQKNTVPPLVSSPSHPAERKWYQNNALYFTWKNPVDDASFTGYYYVLDKHANTVPAKRSRNFTANQQVMLANTPGGIWAFHIVSRDTRGAITKAARHYIVYVGAEPARENLFGSTFEASNRSVALSGVTISINHGLFSTTSTASGAYTFGGTLYVGQWEVTASKAGYVSQTRKIALAAGSPLNEIFTLSRSP